MRCTLDVVLVETQELVWHPVQGGTRMWAAVQVSENLPSQPHDKYIVQLFIHTQQHPPAIRVMQLIELTDNRPAGRFHGQGCQTPVAGDRCMQ